MDWGAFAPYLLINMILSAVIGLGFGFLGALLEASLEDKLIRRRSKEDRLWAELRYREDRISKLNLEPRTPVNISGELGPYPSRNIQIYEDIAKHEKRVQEIEEELGLREGENE